MNPSKILVVDDELELERLIRQRFRRQIRAKEFEFVFVNNGLEAISRLQSDEQVDLVLTDLNMPEMDGLTLLSKLPEIDENLKAVVVSAYGDIPNIRTAMNRGAFDFLTKPIDFRDLLITIDKTLDWVQNLREKQQQLQQALSRLEYQAFYDSLTALPNQNLILGRIRQCIEWNQQQEEGQFAVLFLSLDCYRAVKYGLGHPFADALLVQVSRRLENCVQLVDTVARVGTDEFAILLTDIDNMQQVNEIAEQLHQSLAEPFQLNESLITATIYIGICHSNIGYGEPEKYLQAADTAMHFAKVEAKQKTVLFNPSMQASATRRLQLEADLRLAIRQNQLSLNYQPIFSLETNHLDGFEVLVRWHHPNRGWISPGEFIPLAEETGLIISLGQWVLTEACQQLLRWQEQFPATQSLSLSINVSGVQLWNDELFTSLDQILETTSLTPDNLKLEITESILMQRGVEITERLNQLKQRNIQLCMDDFGTGYSSLAYLQVFPIDILKIDRSFICGIERQPTDLEIVQSIITLAHALGLQVVAEGIETEEQFSILRSLACEYGQGYLMSRPLNSADATTLIVEYHQK